MVSVTYSRDPSSDGSGGSLRGGGSTGNETGKLRDGSGFGGRGACGT